MDAEALGRAVDRVVQCHRALRHVEVGERGVSLVVSPETMRGRYADLGEAASLLLGECISRAIDQLVEHVEFILPPDEA